MQQIERLNWDSNFFGIRIGRSIVDDERNFDPIKFREEAKNNYDLVYVFSHRGMLTESQIFEAKLELMDISITMSMPVSKDSNYDSDFDFRTDLTNAEINECYEIAEQISVVSRFYNEPFIGPEKTKALYRKWIDNAINNSYCDGILLKKSGESITGIHVIKTDYKQKTGLCSLIGVNKNDCGKGIGNNLWQQALTYWTSNEDITKCLVPFSINNTESFNFHLKIGFNKIEDIKFIYHFRNNNTAEKR